MFLTPKYLGIVMEYGGTDLGAYLKGKVRIGFAIIHLLLTDIQAQLLSMHNMYGCPFLSP